ncbi:ATP-grasp domain-containing protein [Paenibacillus thermotolerans]|uniref:ATP-grasp domain-containing protein n=1 Tax=Paenibacillus thermotolerans TaxID=3027807 RepID=UPI002367678E|nr:MULTISPECIES: ATP-grasp domain-containing protein [unclassified Paenibacillus]
MTRNLLSGTPYSPFYTILTNSDPQVLNTLAEQLPLVVKMPKSVGSKDVFKVTSKAQLEAVISKISPQPHHPVIVEQYLDGPQYLVEVIVYSGQTHIVAFIRQEVEFNGQSRFIITGYSVILDRSSEIFQSAEKTVQSIVERHGLANGSFHMELRLVNGEWKVIEINSRMSGSGMNQLIEYAYGINLLEETIKLWLGEKPNLSPKHRKHTYNQFITAPRSGLCKDIIGVSEARECPGVRQVFVSSVKGRRLRPPLSMYDRYAYVIANGDTEEEAERNAKSAASLIRFVMWR